MVSCTTSALVCTSCKHGVQENWAICLVVIQSAEILGIIICFAIHFLCVTIEYYDLSFGMYFLYTSCTTECCNRLGRTPICRDSRVNHMFRYTIPKRDN